MYNEREKKVSITVLGEKIRDRLCFKGAKVIKGIEFVDPPKPGKPKQPEKSKEPEKPDINATFVDPPNEPNHDG